VHEHVFACVYMCMFMCLSQTFPQVRPQDNVFAEMYVEGGWRFYLYMGEQLG